MCGIISVVSNEKIKPATINSMLNVIQHRGPDSRGVWISDTDKVALAHRRLSIIDLSKNAAQPMVASLGDKIVIVFNGEIYNFRQIRSELEKLGHKFQSASDTEVLLHSYIEWGEKLTEKLNGMWAFVIYDERKNIIFASRDRVGMKPLYIYRSSSELILASEIKSIINHDKVSVELDYDALVEYFSFQNIISNKSLFKNISYVPAGHNIIYDIEQDTIKQYCYWDYKFAEDNSLSLEEQSIKFKNVFMKSLGRHLISDVDIGVTLSGGMDSSSIVALASKQIRNLNTFTGFFDTRFIEKDDRCHSEHEDARIIAQKFDTNHYERLITPSDMISSMPSIVWHLEDPKVAMCYTFYAISQLLSQKVTVNLSGTGGDELFGGYPWRYGLVENTNNQEEFYKRYYKYWCRLISDEGRKNFFTDRIKANVDMTAPYKSFLDVMKPQQNTSIINQAFYFELKTFLVGMLLVEDKMGMAFSTETRFPFLDKEIVDFAMQLPSHFKYQNNEAKLLLKKAMKDILPEETIYKRKQGFTPPDQTWYRNELNYYVSNLLLSKKSLIGEFINRTQIENILLQHNNKVQDNRMLIWSLVFFEGWLKTFLNHQGRSNTMF